MIVRRLFAAALLLLLSVAAFAPAAAAAPVRATSAAPTINWGYGNMHPGDGENLFLTGFDFSKPVTIKFFDQNLTTTYYPSARFTLWTPPDADFGPHTISASQGDLYAEKVITLTAWTPTASASSTEATVNQRLTFNAEGFASNDTVRLLVNGRDQDRTATAGSSVNYYYTQGMLTGAFGYRIPEKFRDTTVTFTLKSDVTGALATVSVNVAP